MSLPGCSPGTKLFTGVHTLKSTSIMLGQAVIHGAYLRRNPASCSPVDALSLSPESLNRP